MTRLPPIPPSPPPCPFGEPELALIRMAAEGYTDQKIGTVLGLKAQTVNSRIARMLGKTGTRNRAHLAATAIRRGWIK